MNLIASTISRLAWAASSANARNASRQRAQRTEARTRRTIMAREGSGAHGAHGVVSNRPAPGCRCSIGSSSASSSESSPRMRGSLCEHDAAAASVPAFRNLAEPAECSAGSQHSRICCERWSSCQARTARLDPTLRKRSVAVPAPAGKTPGRTGRQAHRLPRNVLNRGRICGASFASQSGPSSVSIVSHASR